MAELPLFSSYSTGENRVTSSMIAVFERIDISLLQRILSQASEIDPSELPMVTFRNQAAKGTSIPDAEIRGQFHYLFETKTDRNAVREPQLKNHLAQLDGLPTISRLFVVTPDEEPPNLKIMDDSRVLFANFSSIDQAIAAILTDPTELIPDREAFLLSELRRLFAHEDLVRSSAGSVIVAARRAWPAYLKYGAYLCQVGRTFRPGTTHIGFYSNKQIRPIVAHVKKRFSDVEITGGHAEKLKSSGDVTEQRLGKIIGQIVDESDVWQDGLHQVFLLGQPGDPQNIELDSPILHEQPFAWTQYQRYIAVEHFGRAPKTTLSLETTS